MARAAFVVSGPDVERDAGSVGAGLSAATTFASAASRAGRECSFYVRRVTDGEAVGRADADGVGNVTVWNYDALGLDESCRAFEIGPVNERKGEVVSMAARTRSAGRAGAKKSTAKRSPAKAAAKRSPARKSAPARPVLAGAGRVVEKKMSAAQAAAVAILTKDGGEMKVSDLAAQVVKSGKVELGGKTPEATVAAQIYVAAKAGRWFRKTSRGMVALIPAS